MFLLTLSMYSLADGSSSLGKIFSLVVIWISNKPKRYISDFTEISSLYGYSGAMHPLNGVNIKSLLSITGKVKRNLITLYIM